MTPLLKVLVADDSPTARQLMVHLINTTSDMRVVAEATNGRQAVDLTRRLNPDVILMDIVMPVLDGMGATREIMRDVPTPIVMITAEPESHETDIAFQAIRLGALSVLNKPVAPTHPDYARMGTTLVNTVRAMAGVRVIHHRTQSPALHRPEPTQPFAKSDCRPEIVAIASSTGGPAALSEIFKRLPNDFGLPVVVVQHISPEFLPSLVDWLRTTTALKIEIARVGDYPRPGLISFAPGNAHLRLSRSRRFELDQHTSMPYIPSGDILLNSVAARYGSNAIGVVLTGMGSDGARGLQAMHSAGAYTIAQDETTSVVFGMPQEAIALGAARAVLPIQAIAQAFAAFCTNHVTQPSDCVL